MISNERARLRVESAHTLQVMDEFAAAFRRYTGQPLSPGELWWDVDRLREAVEQAVEHAARRGEPRLYEAAERLALALRGVPPPSARVTGRRRRPECAGSRSAARTGPDPACRA